MEIKGYDRYHIGIKLNPSVKIQELKELVLKLVGTNGFQSIDKPRQLIPSNIADFQNFSIDELMQKEDVKVHIHLTLNALNCVGKDPETVTKVFDEVIRFILNSGMFEEEVLVLHYETIAEVVMSNSRKPIEIFNDITRLDLNSFNDLGKLNVSAISLVGGEESSLDADSLRVTILAHPSRPSKDFLLQVIKRDKDRGNALENYKKINESSIKLLK